MPGGADLQLRRGDRRGQVELSRPPAAPRGPSAPDALRAARGDRHLRPAALIGGERPGGAASRTPRRMLAPACARRGADRLASPTNHATLVRISPLSATTKPLWVKLHRQTDHLSHIHPRGVACFTKTTVPECRPPGGFRLSAPTCGPAPPCGALRYNCRVSSRGRPGRVSGWALGAALAVGLLGPATVALAGPSPQRTVRVRLAASANPDGASAQPSVSGDARRIAFASRATNLVAADENGEVSDIFVYDQGTSALERVSAGPNGEAADGRSEQPALSGDGTPGRVHVARSQSRPRRSQRGLRRVRARPRHRPRPRQRVERGRRGRRRVIGARPSPPTGATSCSPQMPPTSSRVTQTGSRTCSSVTCSPR